MDKSKKFLENCLDIEESSITISYANENAAHLAAEYGDGGNRAMEILAVAAQVPELLEKILQQENKE